MANRPPITARTIRSIMIEDAPFGEAEQGATRAEMV